jgi:glycosyltransferase involved in cell wall biosynthesis
MDDIGNAMEILLNNGLNKNDITILHCNTEYPTPFEDVNLRAMQTIAKRFAVKVGYSDHTQGIEASIAAVALGATVIEKHFTLSRDMEGPDHKASLEPDELKAMVAAIRNVEKALGNGEKQVTDSERKNMNIARKSIVAAKDIKKGAIFAEDNITVKRPGNGISPMRWEEVLGKTANRDFCEDELIELENENEEILVSIIIPVYTVEISFLETCLDSALNQTYTNLEILLIDDKSPDENVIRTLELYAQKDKRIRLIKKQQNDGVSITRQQGVNISAGGYICFLDCDDYLTLNCIELLLHKAKTTNADIIVGDYWRTYDTFKIQYPHSLNEQSSTGYLVAMLTSKCGGTIWGKLIKSDILKKIDIPVFKGRDNDSLANFYFACGNFKIVSLGQPIYNWVYRKTSVTLTRKQSSVQYGFRIVNEICKLIKDQPCFNEIQNEFAYYKLSVWSLLLSHGIKYNNDNKAFRGDIAICWKNQWAKRQLKSSQKIILFCNQKPYLRVIYILYTHIGKPILLKFFLKPYRNILK